MRHERNVRIPTLLDYLYGTTYRQSDKGADEQTGIRGSGHPPLGCLETTHHAGDHTSSNLARNLDQSSSGKLAGASRRREMFLLSRDYRLRARDLFVLTPH